MEYKSPEDHLDIDAFYKAGAYASLYKAYGETTDEIKADDITVSLVREAKPRGLFQYFKEHNYSISNPYHGIYYIGERVLFPTQIIVTGELDSVSHIWLGALSEKMSKQDMLELFKSISKLSGKADREFADSVLEISIGANKQIMEELRGEYVPGIDGNNGTSAAFKRGRRNQGRSKNRYTRGCGYSSGFRTWGF